MIKSTSVLRVSLCALVMVAAMTAFTAQPAGAQTAKKLNCTGCVKSKQLQNDGIKSKDIKDGHVKNADLADGAVTGNKIVDGAVGLNDLGFDPATQAELDNTDTLGDLSCASGQIAKLDGSGRWSCGDDIDTTDTDWNNLSNVPADIADGDTLDSISCDSGQVAKWNGSAWDCAADADGAGDIALLMTKTDNLARLQARGASAYVFTTSERYNGNLGGVAGADEKCQTLADAAGLPGLYKAWIADSDPLSAPDSHFTQAPGAYILPPGDAPNALATVAESYALLTTANLLSRINVAEDGTRINSGTFGVWTNVLSSGLQGDAFGGSSHCDDWNWTGGFATGAVGSLNITASSWSAQQTGVCSSFFHLYCFGQ